MESLAFPHLVLPPTKTSVPSHVSLHCALLFSSYFYNLVFLLHGSLQAVFVCCLVYQLEDNYITKTLSLPLCSRNQPNLRLHSFGLSSKFLGKGASLAQFGLSAHPLSHKLGPASQGHEIKYGFMVSPSTTYEFIYKKYYIEHILFDRDRTLHPKIK